MESAVSTTAPWANDSTNSTADGDNYDYPGALKFTVALLLVYSLLGILSLLMLRMIRRAKLRQHRSRSHSQMSQEECHMIRVYHRAQQQLQMEAHRQKLTHEKTKMALALWNTDIPALTDPLLASATATATPTTATTTTAASPQSSSAPTLPELEGRIRTDPLRRSRILRASRKKGEGETVKRTEEAFVGEEAEVVGEGHGVQVDRDHVDLKGHSAGQAVGLLDQTEVKHFADSQV